MEIVVGPEYVFYASIPKRGFTHYAAFLMLFVLIPLPSVHGSLHSLHFILYTLYIPSTHAPFPFHSEGVFLEGVGFTLHGPFSESFGN